MQARKGRVLLHIPQHFVQAEDQACQPSAVQSQSRAAADRSAGRRGRGLSSLILTMDDRSRPTRTMAFSYI